MPHVDTAPQELRSSPSWSDQPVLARLWRDGYVESQHRGAWVLVDSAGAIVDGQGDWNQPVFPRSATKSLQALPLIESGAADRFGMGDDELALTLASHHAEPIHVERVQAFLARIGLTPEHLKCGPQTPVDAEARRSLLLRGGTPTALHNNCSGKHAGFLALSLHLGDDLSRYLDPHSKAQRLVHDAVEAMSGVRPGELHVAIDGCSAPTFHMPLASLATALARVANPDGLPSERALACARLTRAAERHPELIGATNNSLCSDLLRVSGGRLFPKLGTEAVYVIGVRGADRGLAVKIDDGAYRAMNALVIDLLERFDLLDATQLAALSNWRAGPITNWSGARVGRLEVLR